MASLAKQLKHKENYTYRKENGICISCGIRERHLTAQFKTCDVCRLNKQLLRLKYKNKDLCYCGHIPNPGYKICEDCLQSQDKYKNKNKNKRLVIFRKRNTKQKKIREYYKALVFDSYGNCCTCCGETTKEFLQIDHINGGGCAHRKRISKSTGYPFYKWLVDNECPKDEFQLLCANCNWSKGVYGYCPHKKSCLDVIPD